MRHLILLVLTGLLTSPAMACPSILEHRYHYPSCTIPLPTDVERVVQIDGYDQGKVASHHLGDPLRHTQVFDIDVAANDYRNYLVLNPEMGTSETQVIWRVSGSTASISRVIVLGAAGVSGVIGVPKERVHFATPDLTAVLKVPQTSCNQIALSCTAAQWFGDSDHDRIMFNPPSSQIRQRRDAYLRALTSPSAQEPIILSASSVSKTLVQIDPTRVASINPPQPYDLIPGQPGLDAQVADGRLLSTQNPGFDAKVAEYAERFSAPYRSRFDPDFLFEPVIDYIATQATTLPPELPAMTVLVPETIPQPALSARIDTVLCRHKIVGRPEPTGCAVSWVNSPFPTAEDRAPPYHMPLWTLEHDDIYRAAALYDARPTTAAKCRTHSLPQGTHVQAVLLHYAHNLRHLGSDHTRVTIDIQRRGPVALYLSDLLPGMRWDVSGPEDVVIFGSAAAKVHINGAIHDPIALGGDGCPWVQPPAPARLGPAIKYLDEMVTTLTGQPIDSVIAHVEGRAARRDPRPLPFAHHVID